MEPRRSSMVISKERMRKRIDEDEEEGEEAKMKEKPSYPPLSPTVEEKTKTALRNS